jgi:hypothetical protein
VKRLFFSLVLLTGVLFCFLPQKYPYRLAVCAIFKNEAPWLKEWLIYHCDVLGAERFYLYNNDSTDEYLKILQPYIEKGIVELIDWSCSDPNHFLPSEDPAPWSGAQIGAYNDCLKNKALKKAKWVAMIDIDEFIVPVHGIKSFYRFLHHAEKKRKGTIKIPWRIFGTSHVIELKPGELLTEKLKFRADDSHYWHNWAKSLHRPEGVQYCHIHDAVKMTPHFRREMSDPNELRIHHYWTRTEKFCREKRKEGDFSAFNQVEDDVFLQYVPSLRKWAID